jgi:RNA polymerase sigma-70 factor (ECF subfamily)
LNSDWDCFIRAQQGNETSCRELIDKFQSRLLALAILITGSPAAAKDIAQETFIRALNVKLKDTAGTVQGYLATIAYRLALKELKRERRNTELIETDHLNEKPNSLDNVLINEQERLVARAIHSLNTEHRDALVLRFYGGHSFEEIAGLLNIPLGTAKSRVFYAVKACRETLREKGVLE